MKIKSFNLNDVYIPNRRAHLEKWASDYKEDHDHAFTCDISDDDVCKIMLLNDIDEIRRILPTNSADWVCHPGRWPSRGCCQ